MSTEKVTEEEAKAAARKINTAAISSAADDAVEGYAELRKQKQSILDRIEKRAREHDQLLGRVFKQQVADGYAMYLVVKVYNDKCTLEHLSISDGWRHQMVEDFGRVLPAEVVEKNVRRSDAMREMFSDDEE